MGTTAMPRPGGRRARRFRRGNSRKDWHQDYALNIGTRITPKASE